MLRSWEPANVPLFLILFLTPSIFAYLVPRGYTYDFFRPPYTYIALTLLARLRVCVNVYTAGTVMYSVYTHPTYISHYPTDSIYRLLLHHRSVQTTARSASRLCSLKKHPFFHRCYNITIIIMFLARILYACERVVYNIIYIHSIYLRCTYAYMHLMYIYCNNGLRISFFFLSGLDNDRGTCLDFIPPTRRYLRMYIYASARLDNNGKGVFAFSSPYAHCTAALPR